MNMAMATQIMEDEYAICIENAIRAAKHGTPIDEALANEGLSIGKMTNAELDYILKRLLD